MDSPLSIRAGTAGQTPLTQDVMLDAILADDDELLTRLSGQRCDGAA